MSPSTTPNLFANAYKFNFKDNSITLRFNFGWRGVIISSTMCPFGNACEENEIHIFKKCSTTKEIHGLLIIGWNDLPILNNSFDAFLGINSTYSVVSRSQDILESISRALLWTIWANMNSMLFNSKMNRLSTLAYEVKILSFLWLKSRAKWGKDFLWDSWVNNPL